MVSPSPPSKKAIKKLIQYILTLKPMAQRFSARFSPRNP